MRRLLLTLVAVMVVGCSTASATGETPSADVTAETPSADATAETPTAGTTTEAPTTAAEPSPTNLAPLSVTGDPATGASAAFALAGGSYDVDWTTTADTAGCYFSLVLTTKVGGPSVKNGVKLLSEAKSYSGTFTWVGVFAGTYVLQEDRSGYAHCAGPWSATVTSR